MARKFKKSKVSICVFCEGESEQAYIDFLKSEFHDVAVFKRPSSPGLFDDADNRFKKTPDTVIMLMPSTKFGSSLMSKKRISAIGLTAWKSSSVCGS